MIAAENMETELEEIESKLFNTMVDVVGKYSSVLPCQSLVLRVPLDEKMDKINLGYRLDKSELLKTFKMKNFVDLFPSSHLSSFGDDAREIINKSIPIPIRVEITNQLSTLSFSTTFRLVIDFWPANEKLNLYRLYYRINSDETSNIKSPIREYGIFIEMMNMIEYEFFRRNPNLRTSNNIFRVTEIKDEQNKQVNISLLCSYQYLLFNLAKNQHSSFLKFCCTLSTPNIPRPLPHHASTRVNEELFMYFIQSRAFDEAIYQEKEMKKKSNSNDFRSRIFYLIPFFFTDPKKFRKSSKHLLEKIEKKIYGTKRSRAPTKSIRIPKEKEVKKEWMFGPKWMLGEEEEEKEGEENYSKLSRKYDSKIVPNSVLFDIFGLLFRKKNDRRFGRLDVPLFRFFLHLVFLNALYLSDFSLAFAVGTKSHFFDSSNDLLMYQYFVALKTHVFSSKLLFENQQRRTDPLLLTMESKKKQIDMGELSLFELRLIMDHPKLVAIQRKITLCEEYIECWTHLASGMDPKDVTIPEPLMKTKGFAMSFHQVFELMECSCVLMLEKGFEESFKIIYFLFFHQQVSYPLPNANANEIEPGNLFDADSFSNMNRMLRAGNLLRLPHKSKSNSNLQKDPFGATSLYSVLDEVRFYDILIRKYLQYADCVYPVLENLFEMDKKVGFEDVVISFVELCAARGRPDLAMKYIQFGINHSLKVMGENAGVYFRMNRIKIEVLMMKCDEDVSKVMKKVSSIVQFCVMMVEKGKVRCSFPKVIIREILECFRSGEVSDQGESLLLRVPCAFCEDIFVVIGMEHCEGREVLQQLIERREKVGEMKISEEDEDLLEMLYYVPVSAFLAGDFVTLERWIKMLSVFEFFGETYTRTKRSRHLFQMVANIYYFEKMKRKKMKNRIFDNFFDSSRRRRSIGRNEEKIFVIGNQQVLPWAFHRVHPKNGPPSRLIPIFWDGLAIQDLQEPDSRAGWILKNRIQMERERNPKGILKLIFMLGDQDLQERIMNGKAIHPNFLQHTESFQIQILVNLYLSFLSKLHKKFSPNLLICVIPLFPFLDFLEERRVMRELFSTDQIFSENRVRLFNQILGGCLKTNKRINFLEGLDSFVWSKERWRVKKKFDLGYGNLVRVDENLLAELEQKLWVKA